MKADILTLKTLFQKDVRYLVPTFQRPYVWNQEDQWEPLWDDIRNTAERYLENLADLGVDRKAEAETTTPAHFLGAVVLQQRATPSADIEARDVIDGQQRLTTLQLLLDAIHAAFLEAGCESHARVLSRLVVNHEDYAQDNPDHVFKIWPTGHDREAFRRAMHDDLSDAEFEDSPIVQAHRFFQLQVEQWLATDPAELSSRADALQTALLALLNLVVIDLELKDNAHVIFETLNARGTPLLASDLVRNYLLHSARESGIDADKLHRDHWRQFDDTWWRAEVRQGRLVRPRIDTFLNYWLVMARQREIQAEDVFREFQRLNEALGTPVEELMATIQRIGTINRQLESKEASGREATFLYRWQVMDARVLTPLLLRLYSQPADVLVPQRRQRALEALESYLVRRMVCRMSTMGLNRLFIELLVRLEAADPATADDVIVGFLRDQTAATREWPSDDRVRSDFHHLPLFRLLTRGRLRMVLEAIEEQMRSPKAESPTPPAGLTIEHVMPQAWRDHWALPAATEDEILELIQARDHAVHGIGNLTLVNGHLNPALSNAAWADKRAALGQHSVLHLNHELLEHAGDQWDESAIALRADRLFERAAAVWPSGQDF